MIFVHKYFLPVVLVRAFQRNRASRVHVCVCVCVCACVCERELVLRLWRLASTKSVGQASWGLRDVLML